MGRSFNDIGTAIVGKITDINKAFQATDDLVGSIKNSDSILKRLYPSKESIKEQLIDVDSLIPEIDKNKFDFDGWINKLNAIDKQVKAGTLSWQDYSNGLKDNQKWIAKWGQETEGQIRTQSDLIKANKQARASALAHNEAIKAQIFSAKAGKAALQALSVAGNMILFTVIAKGVQLATTALDNWINRSKYAVEAMEKAQQSINDAQNKLKNVSSAINENKDRFLELSEGVDKFSKNIKLSEEDYAEYLSISNKLAEISPELVTGYTEQGDALLHIGDNAEETSEKLNKILEAEKAIEDFSQM